MKKILIAALVVVAVASCSKNETTDVITQKGISFGVVKGNSVETRAASDAGDSDEFGVYAFNNGNAYENIANTKLKKTDQTWGLDKVYYYPEDDSEVSFWSYGPHNQGKLSDVTCEADKGPKFTLTLGNTDNAVDIWATQEAKTGKKSSSSEIILAHKRILAQVKFQAYTTDKNNFMSKIESITVKAKGTADYANSAWGTPTNELTWTALNTEKEITATSVGTAVPDAVSLNMIPKDQEAEIVIKANIYNLDGSVKLAAVTSTLTLDGSTYPYWAQGKAYTYVIKITPANSTTAITFGTPTIEEWSAASSSDIDVPTPAPAP